MEKILFFDTEFTGLVQNTNLLSIGIVSDTGDYFYAEDGYVPRASLDPWIKENVIANFEFGPSGGVIGDVKCYTEERPLIDNRKRVITKNELKYELSRWLNVLTNYGEINIKLVSDVCHYDMVLFADIFGGAMQIPSFIAPVCYDINQDIADFYNISTKDAFDKSREKIAGKSNVKFKKHNALYDAYIIKRCYTALKMGKIIKYSNF